MTAEFVNADGTRTTVQYTEANFDGKDYPLTGSQFGADTVSLKRIDRRTTERTDKKGGKVIQPLFATRDPPRGLGQDQKGNSSF